MVSGNFTNLTFRSQGVSLIIHENGMLHTRHANCIEDWELMSRLYHCQSDRVAEKMMLVRYEELQ